MSTSHPDRSFSRLVQEEWTADSTIAAWRRWHEKMVPHLGAWTRSLLDAAKMAPGSKVLDLANGTGEPAATIASLVGAEG